MANDIPFGTQPDPRRLGDPATDQALLDVADITARAKAMGLGLAKYPVADIERLLTRLSSSPGGAQ